MWHAGSTLKDFWVTDCREHGQKTSQGVGCLFCPPPWCWISSIPAILDLVPKGLLWWGAAPFPGDVLFHCFISWNEKIFFLKSDVNTSAAAQVQWLLPCILLFEPFILWKEPTSQHLLYLFSSSTPKSLCLSPFFDHSHCSGFSPLFPPFPWCCAKPECCGPAQISPILNQMEQPICHSGFSLIYVFLYIFCPLVRDCTLMYVIDPFCFLSTWHFFPLVFPVLRFKILFCLKIIWLVDKYRHDFFNIK